MATVSNEDKAKIAQGMEREGIVDYDKITIGAAIQVLEDWFDGDKLVVSGLIDAAISPDNLTNSQKKKIAGYWMIRKAKRELL